LVVPAHLRAAFWDLLARAPEPGAVPAEPRLREGVAGEALDPIELKKGSAKRDGLLKRVALCATQVS
jgi:hypothetical protein